MPKDASAGQRQRGVLRGEVKETVAELLRKQFGAEVDLEFYIGGKNRIYAYRDCGEFEGRKGIYFGTLERDGLRLSIEGSFIVGRVAEKNILELSDEDAMRWLRGEDIEANVADGYWILKWGEYFVGCGKARRGRIRNYVPKDRRLTG